ncbi:MAG: alpha/beta fold hydrolase [Actinobacteria bacterium]|nr:alpha/beta fold hydrolase [Actinomycetota bacterium]
MYAHNGECKLYYDTFGDAHDPTLLLVNGLGSQCINYHEDWCRLFAAEGLHVVRYDNRDVGLSSSYADAPTNARGAAYSIDDMAADGMAVLDALDVAGAHVMGLSMGGMIVQMMAINHPQRVLTMTSVMSTTGEPEYRKSSERAMELLLAPDPTDREGFIQQWVDGLREWGTPAFADESRWRAYAERAFDRGIIKGGTARQYAAVMESGSRADALREVAVPTLVIHGDKDTIIDQIGGRRTAELIPGARFELVEGMGHDYPPQLWARWVALVVEHIRANS